MINGEAIIKGGSVYVFDLDQTFSKAYLEKLSLKEFKMLCSRMEINELDQCQRVIKDDLLKEAHITNIFDRM